MIQWAFAVRFSCVSSRESLREAIEAADLRTLVLCLFHWTGDRKWLEDPYRPQRDVRLIADPSAGFSGEVQSELKTAALAILADGVPTAAIDDPGPELFHELMSVCLGEKVAPEYVALMREDMGYDDGDAHWQGTRPEDLDIAVLIVGAGVSGLCLATKLDALGVPFVLIERNADVGGTWFENTYPGCGVDTPNHFYSYSFALNPKWKHYFSPREELQAYVEECADLFNLRSRIRYNTTLAAAVWDEERQSWSATLTSDGGSETLEARVVVTATGHFNQPRAPHFEGQDTFAGRIVHSARWPDDLDLNGKRVAVIGTGASSMQLVPAIADEVATLDIFQRSPQWVRPVPEYNVAMNPASRWLFEHLPHYAKWYRFAEFWRYGDGLLRYLRKDPEWPYPERSLNRINERHRVEMTEFIERELAAKPELIDDCMPTYPPFGKRILIDNGWFSTLCRDHVSLCTSTIERFEAAGVRTADGCLHEADIIVLATGFAITDLASRVDIRGRAGRRLADDWADENPTAYLGMAVPEFPNFFVMYGPNTNMGHGGSGIFLAETQTRYITRTIVAMAEAGISAIDCRPERRTAYTQEIDELHERLIWTHTGMTTYYRNKHGAVRSPMPFRLVEYWNRTRNPDLGDYRITERSCWEFRDGCDDR